MQGWCWRPRWRRFSGKWREPDGAAAGEIPDHRGRAVRQGQAGLPHRRGHPPNRRVPGLFGQEKAGPYPAAGGGGKGGDPHRFRPGGLSHPGVSGRSHPPGTGAPCLYPPGAGQGAAEKTALRRRDPGGGGDGGGGPSGGAAKGRGTGRGGAAAPEGHYQGGSVPPGVFRRRRKRGPAGGPSPAAEPAPGNRRQRPAGNPDPAGDPGGTGGTGGGTKGIFDRVNGLAPKNRKRMQPAAPAFFICKRIANQGRYWNRCPAPPRRIRSFSMYQS